MSLGYIFLGGSGRSGTSFVADKLGSHPEIVSFKDVELKIFNELHGLIDLQKILVTHYSPNRAQQALQAFDNIYLNVCFGRYGQPALNEYVEQEGLFAIKEEFYSCLFPKGGLRRLELLDFNICMRKFIRRLADFALKVKGGGSFFLEKTPHILLFPEFLAQISRSAKFIHITRDPRGVVSSLMRQNWGPDSLHSAIEWVESYYNTYLEVKNIYYALDLHFMDFRIEDIASDPEYYASIICDNIGIPLKNDLFKGIDIGVLKKGIDAYDRDSIDIVNNKLENIMYRLGYFLD